MDAVTSERCDVCQAKAYVRTIIIPATGSALTWCAHHFTERELTFLAAKYPVIDRRFELEAAVRPAKPRPKPRP